MPLWYVELADSLRKAILALGEAIENFSTETIKKQPQFADTLGQVMLHISQAISQVTKAGEALDDFVKDFKSWEADQKQGKIPGTSPEETKPAPKKEKSDKKENPVG